MHKKPRAVSALLLADICNKKKSLIALQEVKSNRPLVQAICYDVLRNFYELQFIVSKLLSKKLKPKDICVQNLLMIAILQIQKEIIPAYAIVDESVRCCSEINKVWAKSLVNACLRKYLKFKSSIEKELQEKQSNDLELRYNHPMWLINLLKTNYPERWEEILYNNNQNAPMTLRVNSNQTNRDSYLKLLQEHSIEANSHPKIDSAINLANPIDVNKIPGFEHGDVSVQDGAAQLVAPLLSPKDQEKILDACAAPGGKACHILELCPTVNLTAIDCKKNRTEQISQNLLRSKLEATVINMDFLSADRFKPNSFDKILLDVPCSSTGVIRRHPDIKILKSYSEIIETSLVQLQLIQKAWTLLKPKGTLVYSTCSILPIENSELINKFIQKTPDAQHQEIELTLSNHINQKFGQQILPQEDFDGFYIAKLTKS